MRLSSSRVTSLTHRPQQDFLLWDKAGTRPSLDLQFADRRDLVDATTGSNLVDFTRASSGTYVGSDGLIKTATTDEARFDHDPTTGESLGLLVEESGTNLLQYSEDFTDPTWIVVNLNGTLTPDQAVAPDGTITAELYTEDTTTNGRYFAQTFSVTSGTTYTASIWAKQASGDRYLGLVLPAAGFGVNCIASFTLSGAGSYYITTSGTGTTADIQQFPNGWYRCWLTSQATSTASPAVQFRLSGSSTNGTQNYTGDGTSGIYVWGAQLEEGSFPTSYIKNVDAVLGAIRAADVVSISGSNFSSWYRQEEGTIFARYDQPEKGFSLAVINDGTNSNSIVLFGATVTSQQISANMTISAANQGRIDAGGSFVANATSKVALATSTNGRGLSCNGSAVTASANPSSMPTLSELQLQGSSSFTARRGGHIARFAYWPQRLPNDTLQTITQ
jgi:hypothetical protein